jgi:hypothetical protein
MTAGVGMSTGAGQAGASFPKAQPVSQGEGEATDAIDGRTLTPTHHVNDPNFG